MLQRLRTENKDLSRTSHFSLCPMYFKGITFDLTTGECVNPQPDPVREINKEVNTEWRRKYSEYKRQWQIRAKLGAFDHIVEEAARSRRKDITPERVIEAVRSCSFEQTFVLSVIAAEMLVTRSWWSRTVAPFDTLNAFERVYARHRDAVRQQVGCFV
jgi:hypothetical protein